MNTKSNNLIFNISLVFVILFGVYLFFSIYFSNRFLPRTFINGIDISFKTLDEVNNNLLDIAKDYTVNLYGRDGVDEIVKGSDINLTYSINSKLDKIKENQNSFSWIFTSFNKKDFITDDLFQFNKDALRNVVSEFKYFNKESIIPPLSPCFKYNGEEYIIIDEIYGNKVNEEYLFSYLNNGISYAITELNLEEIDAYENPSFTSKDKEVIAAKNKLDKYIQSIVYYEIDDDIEILDKDTIHTWLEVDERMNVYLNENKIYEYVKELAENYNTYEKDRIFKTSTGIDVTVKGGNYGWRIDVKNEYDQLLKDISSYEVIKREPIYTQIALGTRNNDIGDTYVEINLTKQLLWLYVDGQVVTEGEIVTGNVNRGNGTPEGTYYLNYKQKDATLKGENYESFVQYWMPFNGNIGIHDASWRWSFGGNIFNENGSHGCVNAPLYLAKTIYENIEPGTPIICYKE